MDTTVYINNMPQGPINMASPRVDTMAPSITKQIQASNQVIKPEASMVTATAPARATSMAPARATSMAPARATTN